MELGIGSVDAAMLVVLAISLAVGTWRGLVFEVLAIVGWFVAYFCARWAAPQLAPHLPVGSPGSLLNEIAAFLLAFVVALIAWGLLSRFIRGLIRATPLAPIDRLLGAVFGLLRGVIVLLVLALLVSYTPAAMSPSWQRSVGAGWLSSALLALRPLLPTASRDDCTPDTQRRGSRRKNPCAALSV